jgi:hypothetical protein
MRIIMEASDIKKLKSQFPKASINRIKEAGRSALICNYETIWEKVEDMLQDEYGTEE